MTDDTDVPAKDPELPGQASTGQVSAHDKSKQSKRLMTAGIIVLCAVVGFGIYKLATWQRQQALPPRVLPKSDPQFPIDEKPKVEERIIQSHLQSNPPFVTFPGNVMATKDRSFASISLTAVDGPVDITDINLPFAQESDLDMRADNCQHRKLAKGESCGITVQFLPVVAVSLNNRIDIRGLIYESQGQLTGKTFPLSVGIDISGASVLPPPPPPPVVVPNYDAERMDRMQAAFLAQRERQTLGDQANRIYWKGPQLPEDKDWKGVGFAKNESSFPVDMTRVVTMDKAIPVVIKVPIDTRNSSRAVATVERDIYGGDGRVVVIERGSTLIGKVAAIADTSEEKVAINWQRLIRPDGAAFSFQATSGDAMGRSGVLAHIDNRWLERFGKAALLSFLRGGITLALNPTDTSVTQNGTTGSGIYGNLSTGGTTSVSENARALASNQIQSDLLPLYDEFVKEQLALPPIRTVPVGTRITVWPTTDLWLRPAGTGEVLESASSSGHGGTSMGANKGYNLGGGGLGSGVGTPGGVSPRNSLNDVLGTSADMVPGSAPPPGDNEPAVPMVDTNLGGSASEALQQRFSRQSAIPGMTSNYLTQNPNGGVVSSSGQSLPPAPWTTSR